jgi:hypothetical protein
MLAIVSFPKANLLPVERSYLDLRILTVPRGMHKDLIGKIKRVSPATGRRFTKSSRMILKDLGGY